MGKANPEYFPQAHANQADVGNSIIDQYRDKENQVIIESEQTEEPEKCPACGDKVPEMEQLYNEELDEYLHVGCFKDEVDA